jgi:hypothetical protein
MPPVCRDAGLFLIHRFGLRSEPITAGAIQAKS